MYLIKDFGQMTQLELSSNQEEPYLEYFVFRFVPAASKACGVLRFMAAGIWWSSVGEDGP